MAFAMEQNEFSYGIQDPMTEVLKQKKAKLSNMFLDGCPIKNIFFSAETCEFQRFPAAVPMDTSPAEPDRQVEGPENGCVQHVHLLKLGIQQLLCEKVPGISFTKGARFKFHQISASLGRVPILYKHETTYLLLPLKICNLGPCGSTKKPKTAIVPP